jgi:hypothetical protein
VFRELQDNLAKAAKAAESSSANELELSINTFASQLTSNPKLTKLLELSEAASGQESKDGEFRNETFHQVYVVFNQSVTKALKALVDARGAYFPLVIKAQSDYQTFMRKDGTTKAPLDVFTSYEDAFLGAYPEYKDKDLSELENDDTYASRILSFVTSKVDILTQYEIDKTVRVSFPKPDDKKSILGYVNNMRQCAASSRWASTDMGAVGKIVSSVIRSTGLKPGQQVTPQQLNIGKVMMTTMNTFADDEHQQAMIHTLRQFKDKKKRDAIRQLIGAVAPQYSGLLAQMSKRADDEK